MTKQEIENKLSQIDISDPNYWMHADLAQWVAKDLPKKSAEEIDKMSVEEVFCNPLYDVL